MPLQLQLQLFQIEMVAIVAAKEIESGCAGFIIN